MSIPVAFAQLLPPEAPTAVAVYSIESQKLEVRWSSSDAASTTSFKIQWKSGSEEFNSSRQLSSDPATSIESVQSTSAGDRYKATLTGLTDGTEYTVRVVAANSSGDSEPSGEATGTPQATPGQTRLFFENEVVEIFGDSQPWLRETWDYFTARNVPVTFTSGNWNDSGYYPACTSPQNSGSNLWECRAVEIRIGRVEPDLIHAITHELAHAYTLANNMNSTPGPLGIGQLYFSGLVSPPDLGGVDCFPLELYAETLTILTLGDWPGQRSRWSRCHYTSDTPSQQAFDVVRSAAAGEMPAWFADTYNDPDGDPDLERVWADVKAISSDRLRKVTVFQLRDAFGGYCTNNLATNSVFGDNVARNPWRDGGCVPEAPTSVKVTAVGSGKLTVSWQEPLDDGGSPIKWYIIWWKSGTQDYSLSRFVQITDLTDLQRTISGLANDESHTLLVIAYNLLGAGTVEITATPTATDTTAPALHLARFDDAELRLIWNEAIDESSVPASTAFTVNVNGVSRGGDVSILGNVVTLGVEGVVNAADSMTVSYTVPTGSGAIPLRDSAGNNVAGFSAQMVRNDDAQVTLTSDPGSDMTYTWRNGHGGQDVIEATVTFSESVVVSGVPELALLVGGQTRHATYRSGSGTTSLVFRYLLIEGDADADGISIASGAISTAEGLIRYASTKAIAPVEVLLDPQAGHLVDAIRPAVISAGALANGADVTLTWDKALDEDSSPYLNTYLNSYLGFRVQDTSNNTYRSIRSISILGQVVTLRLSSAISVTDQLTVSYDSPSIYYNEWSNRVSLKDTAGNYPGPISAAVTITRRPNSPPEFPSSEDGARSVDENTPANRNIGTAIAATDADNNRLTYSISGVDAAFFDVVASSGQLRTKAALDHESHDSYSFTMSVRDGRDVNGDTDTAIDDTISVTVTVNDVDEPPVVTGAVAINDYDENGTGYVAVYTAADPENKPGLTYTWSLGGADRGDFAITSAGVLSFVSIPDYERPADSGGNNEYLVVVVATDDGGLRGTLNVTVAVRDVNEAPTVTGDETPSFPENRTAAVATYRAADPERDTVSWSVSGTDSDDFDISEAGVLSFASPPDFENPADANQDNVYMVTVEAGDDGSNLATLGVTVTVTNSTGPEEPTISTTGNPSPYRENGTGAVYTFRARDPQGGPVRWAVTGTDSDAFEISSSGVLAFSSPPDFENPDDADRDNDYEMTVVATDEQRLTDSLDVTVTVSDVNEGPVVAGRQSLSFSENQATDRVLASYSAIDPEDPSAPITRWSLSGSDAGDFAITVDGGLSFRSVPDFERPADSNRDNVYSFSVRASDGRNYGYLEVTVTVEDVNEAPEITTAAKTSFSYRENGTATIYTFRAADPERGPIEWSPGGADGDDFAITVDSRGRGVLAFSGPPDFESPTDADRDNVYEVTVVATDDQSLTDSVAVTVTVSDVNEGPEISGRQSLSFSENQATDRVLASYTATDPEDPNAAISRWSLSGRDARDFTVSEGGELSFRNVPDFERPADSNRDNVYSFSVRASDGRNYVTLEVTVTVEDVNEAPVITTAAKTAFSYRENATATIYTFRAADPERSAIEWSLSGPDSGDFAVYAGMVTFRHFPDFENPADSGSDNVYEFTVVARDDASIPGSLDVTVTVSDVNEGPVVAGRQSLSFSEGQATDRVLASYSATDPEDPVAPITRWSLSGSDAGDFTVSEGGELAFKNVPDFERPADSNRDNVYSFSVRASDGRNYGYLEVAVTVTDVNEAPEITTAAKTSFSYRENATAAVYTFRAADPERSDIEWSTGGADGDDFTVTLDSRGRGVLAFASPPDFENPDDADRDNVYEFTVVARDDAFVSGSLDVTVTVSDVNEGPVVAGRQSLSFSENQATDRVLASYSAIDPEDPVAPITRWSLSGSDAGDFTVSEGGELAFKNVPDFERPADSNRDNVYSFSVRASDGRNYGYLEVTVTVEDVNETLAITTTTKTSFTYRENGTATIYTFSAADPERAAISWSPGGADGDDFAITLDSRGRGVLTFASPPDYESPTDADRDNVYEVTVVATDSERNRAELEVEVTVVDQNEGPVISGRQSLSFSENQATDRVLASYSATDPEDPVAPITRWGLSGSDAGDFTVSEGGELAFKNVPDFERPADSNRDNVYSFSVRASDGRNYGYLEVAVTIEDVNETPEITTAAKTSFSYRENATATIYTFSAADPERAAISWSPGGADGDDFAITLDSRGRGVLTFASPPDYESPTDADRDNVYEVTVVATDSERNRAELEVEVTVVDQSEGPVISGRQSLSFSENQATDRVLASYSAIDPEDPVAPITRWGLSGSDAGDFTVSEGGELAFKNVPDFERPADSNRDNVYELSVRASDGRNYGYLEVAVTVEDVNEAPEITTAAKTAFSYRENATATIYTFRAADPERSDIEWSLSGPDRGDFAITRDSRGRGVLAFASPPDFESPADSGSDNVYEFTVEVRDDQGLTDSLDVTVTVSDVSEGPVISGRQSLSFSENQATDRVLASYSAIDPEDPVAPITRWGLSGSDAGDFTVSEGGELAFKNVPDFERPADSNRDNVYELSVRASDGRNYGYLEVAVTVTDVNEAPEITTAAKTAFSYRENATATIYTFRAADPERSDIEWSLSGPDRGDFAITRDSRGRGVLAFASPPDFESPADSGSDNVYEFTVEVRDDQGLTDSLDVTVTVSDVSEGPVVAGRQSLSFSENQATDRVLASYSAIDPEDPVAPITRWGLSGSDAGDFTVSEGGELAFKNVPDFERPADSNRDNVYELSVRASDGRNYGYLEVAVTVEDVNEAPEITTAAKTAFSYRENSTATIYTFRAADPERSDIEWSLSGPDRGDFAITRDSRGRGVLAFASPPDFESPADSGSDNVYEFTVEVRDDQGLTDSLDVTVTVSDVSEGPVISGRQSLSFSENQATDRVLASYSAIDPEDPVAPITRWGLSGSDAGDFTVSEGGELAFKNVPDFERPADSNRDNVYELSVRASDGRNYGYLEVAVTVTDVNEAPEITTAAKTAFSYRENATATIYTFRAADPERSDIEWSLSGPDRGDFAITRDSRGRGVLAFASPPDFESPADSGSDNVYEFTVVATDEQGLTDSLDVTVTVSDVSEGPVISGRQSLSFSENQATDRVLASYSAIDPEDPVAPITRWGLSGSDAGDFTVTEGGELAFKNVPDFERPADSNRDNVYSFSVRASDGRNYGYLEVIVTVEDFNEAPDMTGSDRIAYQENGTNSLATYRATDPERGTISWTLSGPDSGNLTISDDGVLVFNDPPDYEQPSDSDGNNVYEVTVEAADAEANTAFLEVTVIVTNQTDQESR